MNHWPTLSWLTGHQWELALWRGPCNDFVFVTFFSNHQGATPLVLAKRRGVNKDVIRLLESLEEQEVKGFNRGTHSKLETMQTAESERYEDTVIGLSSHPAALCSLTSYLCCGFRLQL